MRPRMVVLSSVVLSVLASAVTTMLLTRDHGPAPRATGDARIPPPTRDVIRAPEARTDVSLEERVRWLETRAGGAAAPRSKREALETLLAITQGERQVAIADSFRELVSLGEDVIPEIVALLKSGRDQDWGGGFAISGNMVRGYPRLRTVLIDVLRQIGTPAAQQGLLDGLRGSVDMADYRDVFMLFGAARSEILVKGINNEMLPAAVRCLKGEDPRKAFGLTGYVVNWIYQHEFEGRLDLVEEIARLGFEPDRTDGASFALLVDLAPDRAFVLTRQMWEKLGKQGLYRAANALAPDTPHAPIVRYLDLLFASDIPESERLAFYLRVPAAPCETIQPPSARAADARVLLDFLKRRLAVETAEGTRTILTGRIAMLESALQQ